MATAASAAAVIARLVEAVETGVPVLRATADELKSLERDAERISGAALTTVILRDPLLTLRVLRFLQSHRTRSQTHDITTIAHALMMLGQARFFREFDQLPLIEDVLGETAPALERVRAAMSRARLAALYARDWAVQRHDIDPDEVMVGALMHDVVELVAALQSDDERCGLPEQAWLEARAGVLAQLGLPGLIAELADDAQAAQPRIANVRLACRLAYDVTGGWRHPRVADDLTEIQRLLRVSAAEIWERVRRVTLAAAREWRFYQVLPAAAGLVQIAEPESPSSLV